MKALGTGWSRGVRWVDVEVVRQSGGRPTIFLQGEAAKVASALGVERVALTITHTAEQAFAQVIFEREEGYFLGAMYVSYALGCAIVAVAYFTALALWPDAPSMTLCLYLFAGYVPLMPWLYRYSRVIWMHLDYLANPDDSAAGSYEKMRKRQQAQADRK